MYIPVNLLCALFNSLYRMQKTWKELSWGSSSRNSLRKSTDTTRSGKIYSSKSDIYCLDPFPYSQILIEAQIPYLDDVIPVLEFIHCPWWWILAWINTYTCLGKLYLLSVSLAFHILSCKALFFLLLLSSSLLFFLLIFIFPLSFFVHSSSYFLSFGVLK